MSWAQINWAGIALCLTACSAPIADGDDGGFREVYRDTDVTMTAKADLDVDRYLGTWFEIARYPVFFERGCANVTAAYGRIDEDTISVTNVCRDLAGNEKNTIVGFADVDGPGKLLVSFPSVPFGGAADYWVLWTDPAYSIAVVGVRNGRSGWILARDPKPKPRLVARARAVLETNGYDLSRLLTVPQGAG